MNTLPCPSKHTYFTSEAKQMAGHKINLHELKKTNSDRAGSRTAGQIKLEIRNHKIFSPTQIFIRSYFDDEVISSCSHDNCRIPLPPAPYSPDGLLQLVSTVPPHPRSSSFEAKEESVPWGMVTTIQVSARQLQTGRGPRWVISWVISSA